MPEIPPFSVRRLAALLLVAQACGAQAGAQDDACDRPTTGVDAAVAVDAARLEAARRFDAAWQETEAWFVRSGERDAWRDYLDAASLAALESNDAPPHIAALDALYERLRIDHPALDEPPLRSLRAAAADYAWALRLAQVDVEAEAARRYDLLVKLGHRYAADFDPHTARRIGGLVEWLDRAERRPDATAEVRRRWTRPNVIAYADIEFLNDFARRTIDETRVYRENILGTETSGPAHVEARMFLEAAADERRASLVVRLDGTSQCANNVGRNGPAVLRSGSQSRFEARMPLEFDPEYGLKAGRPTVACRSELRVRALAVQTPVLPALTTPIMERAAWKQVAEKQAAAEREIARLTRSRIAERLEKETADALTDLRRRFHETFYVRPRRFDKAPEFATRSTERGIFLGLTQARSDQLAAWGPPPEFDPGTRWGLALHESLFNNIASSGAMFGGSVQTDETVERFVATLTGDVPPDLRVFSNSRPWSVALAPEPVTLRFRDGRIDLELRTAAWSIDDRVFDRPFTVRTRYRVENSVFGATFVRETDVAIEPTDGRPWTAAEQADLLPHVSRKLAALLPSFGRLNNLSVPRSEGLGPIGTAQLRQLSCDDGWLTLGYRREAEPAATAVTSEPRSSR